jgi:nicotinamide phosphoribosyltransferase
MFVSAPTMYKDVYKEFHRPAYHPEVSKVYANYVSRSSKHSNTKTDFTVHVGLQGFIKDFLLADWQHNFFSVDENTAVFQHGRILSAMLGQKVDTTYLRELHRLGYLPLRIKSLPEGTFVPYQVSPVTIENTVEGFQWLTNMIETAFSTDMWYTQTSATTSVAYYATFLKYARMTGLDESFVQFQGHDFSARGLAGRGAWTLAGFGHLASGFVGTDTIPAVIAAEDYYNANVDTELVGCSVPATEHSVTCSWQEEGEVAFYRYLMSMVPTGILSLVFDTWDFWNGVTNILPELKDEIVSRDGTIVIRPDSGDPVKILTGYKVHQITEFSNPSSFDYFDVVEGAEAYEIGGKYYVVDSYDDGHKTRFDLTEIMECEAKGLIECLWDVFGGTITDKGYKLLSDKIGAIYGDSITLERQEQILSRLAAKGFASKVVLGIGSYTYQYVTRDTHGSAIKATNVFKNGRDVAICKEPKTDLGKKSAKGLLRVERVDGKLVQYDQQTREQEQQGLLEVVFEDGKLIKETSLAEIRKLVREQLDQM